MNSEKVKERSYVIRLLFLKFLMMISVFIVKFIVILVFIIEGIVRKRWVDVCSSIGLDVFGFNRDFFYVFSFFLMD